MKARIPNAYLSKQVKEVVSQKYDEIYRDVSERTKETIIKQHMALTLYVLETCYGWRGKRLRDFFNAFISTTYALADGDAIHKPISSALEIVDYISNTYHINIDGMIKLEVDKNGVPINTDKRRAAELHRKRVERQKQRR